MLDAYGLFIALLLNKKTVNQYGEYSNSENDERNIRD